MFYSDYCIGSLVNECVYDELVGHRGSYVSVLRNFLFYWFFFLDFYEKEICKKFKKIKAAYRSPNRIFNYVYRISDIQTNSKQFF